MAHLQRLRKAKLMGVFGNHHNGAALWVGVCLALAACTEVPPLRTIPPPHVETEGERLGLPDGYQYLVVKQPTASAKGGIILTVTRVTAPELNYSSGLVAKRAAEQFCAIFRKHLHPQSYGMFTAPGAWQFERGCI